MKTNMASVGEVIYEDYLYKFTGRSRSILWGKSNPWREKYFILKRLGNRPVLEQYNKKPKTKAAVPKGRIELWPTYRVEKITNMKNRAYVFQLTTPEQTVCLSADDQRNMDMFVFFLQLQSRLKDQIREELFRIDPETSESHRRIGARGSNCVLHVSPYGITLALESNRAILAQWPLKSIRSYESSERGQLCLESGRIAPMGDGLYVFNTVYNCDNQIFDLLDRYVMENLQRVQPGHNQELEDYVWEAERLLGLTVVAACTLDNPDVRHIVQTNWNTELQPQASTRPRPVVHTRLASAQSTSSLNSQNSVSGPHSVPARLVGDNSVRNSPQVPRSLPSFQNSPQGTGSRRGSNQSQSNIADRPPMPPPSGSIPVKIPGQSQRREQYMSMNSTSTTSARSDMMSPNSPFSPSSADWVPPPNFRDAMRQKSTSPIAEHGPYPTRESYLLPSPGAASTPNDKHFNKCEYLTPMSPTAEELNGDQNGVRPKLHLSTPKREKQSDTGDTDVGNAKESLKIRRRRLRSMSCEDLSDYLRTIVYDPISKSTSDLLNEEEGEESGKNVLEPFPRLETYSSMELLNHTSKNGSMELYNGRENYYNIEGLKGKIYDGPMLTVNELRKKFSTKSRASLRRSVSNPNFMRIMNKEKLHSARVNAGLAVGKHENRSSLVNLLPDAIKKHLTKEGKGSNTTLSSGAASPYGHGSRSGAGSPYSYGSRSAAGSPHSSRGSSTQNSPSNSLSRKHKSAGREDIIAGTGVKGINFTKRTRSFRKQKAVDQDNKNKDELPDGDHGKTHGNGMNGDKSVETEHKYENGKTDVMTNGKGAPADHNKKEPPKIARKPGYTLETQTSEATTTV